MPIRVTELSNIRWFEKFDIRSSNIEPSNRIEYRTFRILQIFDRSNRQILNIEPHRLSNLFKPANILSIEYRIWNFEFVYSSNGSVTLMPMNCINHSGIRHRTRNDRYICWLHPQGVVQLNLP